MNKTKRLTKIMSAVLEDAFEAEKSVIEMQSLQDLIVEKMKDLITRRQNNVNEADETFLYEDELLHKTMKEIEENFPPSGNIAKTKKKRRSD